MNMAEAIGDWLDGSREEEERAAALVRVQRCQREAAECEREARLADRPESAAMYRKLARMARDSAALWERKWKGAW